ncbi:hypothetical protein EDD86DRAFT_16250 [Gorgonomyces haynaldii]|nr:hypothetical protein EDD86DRAFT_16250 [Gorgonomyces haynaldii]
MNKLEFIQYCEAYLTKTKSWRAIRNAHISKDQINVDIARMDVQNLLQHYLSQQTHPKAALQDLIQFLLFQRPQGVRGVARAFLHEWVPSHRKHIWLQYGRFLPHKPYHSDSFTDLFADCQNYSPYGTSFEALQLMELMMQPFPGDPRAMALALACAAVAESQLPLGELGAWVALHHSLAPLFMQAHAVSAQWDAEWLKMIQHYFVGYVSLQVLIAIFDLLVLSSVETTEDMTLPSIGTWCQWTAQGLMQLTKDSKIPIHKRCWSVSLADFKQYMKSHYIDKLQQSLEHAHMNLSIDPMDDTVSLDERDFDQDPTVDVQIRIWEQKRQEKLRKRRRQLYYRSLVDTSVPAQSETGDTLQSAHQSHQTAIHQQETSTKRKDSRETRGLCGSQRGATILHQSDKETDECHEDWLASTHCHSNTLWSPRVWHLSTRSDNQASQKGRETREIPDGQSIERNV